MRVTSGARNQPGPARRRGASGHGIRFWIAIALLVHTQLLLVGGMLLYVFAPRNDDLARGMAAEGPPIDVATVDDDAAREIVADLERQEEERKKEEARQEEQSLKPTGQVVDVPAPREEVRPDQARFVSEHDSAVEKRDEEVRPLRGQRAGRAIAAAAPPSRSRPRREATGGWRCGRRSSVAPCAAARRCTLSPAGRPAPRTARPTASPRRRGACSRPPGQSRSGARGARRAAASVRR